jgi:alpha-ketoglutarate-dependent taurine dioxygenase
MTGIESATAASGALPESADVLPVWETRPAGAAVEWASAHREEVRDWIERAGSVLLRGLGVTTAAETGRVAAALGIATMTEREGFAPRTPYPDGVYSSSHWPPDEPMCMHHELSYAAELPGTLLFACLAAPVKGGRTALADSQRILRALPAELVAPFERDGWLLTRMYHEVGVPWPDAFGTRDPAKVEEYCQGAGLACEWLPEGRLRTRQRRSAILRHPRTGSPGWFNQIAFLNALTMDPVVREYLVDMYGPDGLPFNTAYGDGSAISAETIETINEVYDSLTIGESWQLGDVLVIDNLRMAHSRETYDGSREIAAVLGDRVWLEDHLLPLTAGKPS